MGIPQRSKEIDLKALKKMSVKYGWLVPLAGLVWWAGVYVHAGWLFLRGFLP